MRPSLSECMLNTAAVFAERSSCSRLKVGVVITNQEMTTIESVGYNGGAKGAQNGCDRHEPGNCGCLHAEMNALIKMNYHTAGKRMFLTHSPCPMCAKAIVNGGIREVTFREKYRVESGL